MPTQIPPGEKAAFIALVQAAPYPGGPREAERLEDVLNNYEDITTAIYRQLELFASNNAYLTAAMAVFTDADLQIVGIYNAKPAEVTLIDPVLLTNTNVTSYIQITTASPPNYKSLAILGNSTVKEVRLDASVFLNDLYIGPGPGVDIVDASAAAAMISTMWLPFLKNAPSRVNVAVYGSIINKIVLDPGSYYGGVSNNDPENTCNIPVTSFVVGTPTQNQVQLTWDSPGMASPPNAYLFINTYYREKGSNDWIKATEAIGIFNGDEGFTFNKLNASTAYEFKVEVTCTNGGLSPAVTGSATTLCCT